MPPAFKNLYVEALQGMQALTPCDFWPVGQETNTDRNPTAADVAVVADSTDCGQSWNRITLPGDAGRQTSLNKVVFARVTPVTVVTTTTVRHAHKISILCVKRKVHKRVTAVPPGGPVGT